ncbi:protein of unknown function [Kyrpidia spormannii]|uniref:Uncharacterized protein n=1 Tax=Kyrpidia spormannii TaxID=2055160 RepID=A0ACA8ZB38_9BACL|nr:protein of unknown function [Kyrpidia spormannii]
MGGERRSKTRKVVFRNHSDFEAAYNHFLTAYGIGRLSTAGSVDNRGKGRDRPCKAKVIWTNCENRD